MPQEKPADFIDGPVLTLLGNTDPFDVLYLLHTPAMEKNQGLLALTGALASRYPKLTVKPRLVRADDPRTYEILYRSVRAVCEEARSAYGDKAEFHVLLSPGTAQMHATWVLLTKTIFPATTWQTSEHPQHSPAEVAHIPFDIEAELLEPVRQAARFSAPPIQLGDFVVVSQAMRKVVELASRVAVTDSTIVLRGETGVGKGELAKLIHSRSSRSRAPFTKIDCAAIPPSLLEGELFGHVRGSFTSAIANQPGLFEKAQGGTVFLDEVGELSPELQTRLLGVLQDRRIRRIGANEETSVDVRIIAATHQPIEEHVKTGRFREDLFFRLAVVLIHVPSLRERPDDIPPLIDYFLARENRKRAARSEAMLKLAPAARRRLERHRWPGNVRELAAAMERLAALVPGPTVSASHLDEYGVALASAPSMVRQGRTLNEVLENIERSMIEEALKEHGTQTAAAAALGLGSKQALQKRIARLGIQARRFRR